MKNERKHTHPSRLGDRVSRLVDDAAFLGIRCLLLSCVSLATFSLFLLSLHSNKSLCDAGFKEKSGGFSQAMH